MQHLDVISVNIWQILIALINLTILFLLLKKFLYKPVQNVLKKRQDELDSQYRKADETLNSANEAKAEYETRLNGAKIKADSIIADATATAEKRSKRIIDGATQEADTIINRAKSEAKLQKTRAEKEIKDEIIDVSASLAEKLLEREINADDHKRLIDSFITTIGEDDDIIE